MAHHRVGPVPNSRQKDPGYSLIAAAATTPVSASAPLAVVSLGRNTAAGKRPPVACDAPAVVDRTSMEPAKLTVGRFSNQRSLPAAKGQKALC